MLIKTKATLLTAESKPYSFEGRDGISSKIRVLVDGDILPLRATEEEVVKAQASLGKKGDLEFNVTSRKENIKVEFVSFV